MRKNGRRTKKPLLFIIIVIIAVVGCFSALVFSNSSYTSHQYKLSSNILGKLVEAQKPGSTVTFNSGELNEVISPIAENKTSGSITIRGVNAEIGDSTLKFYIPAAYKGIKVLLTTEGTVSYKNGNIIYHPQYFKVGKLSIPESYALKSSMMDKLAGKLGGDIDTQNNTISILSDLIPIKIRSIDIKNQVLLVHTDTKAMSIRERLEWFDSIIKHGGNSGILKKFIQDDSTSKAGNIHGSSFISEVGQVIGTDGSKPSVASANTSVQSGSKSSASNSSTIGKSTAAAAGSSTSGEVKSSDGSVSSSEPDNPGNTDSTGNTKSTSSAAGTSGKQEVVSEIMSAVNSHDKSALGSIQQKYDKLSPEDQAEVQSSVMSMVDSSTLNKIEQYIK